jgi:titin
MNKKLKILFTIILLSGLLVWGCVESVTTPQAGKPSITINSPLTGDTVHVGENEIDYDASDYMGGEGLDKYEIFINDELLKTVQQNDDGTNPKLTLDIDSANFQTTISYFVNVANKEGIYATSEKQTDIYVGEKKIPPERPYNLVLNRGSTTNRVYLFWEDSSDNEDGFEIWRKGGTEGDFILLKKLQPNSISTYDILPSQSLVYYYKVRAFNEYGNSPYSNTVNSEGSSGFDLQAQALGASAVQLTWNDNSTDELGFRIQRTDPGTGEFEQLTVTSPNTTEYIDNDVIASTTYRYRIASFTSQTQSAWSNEVTVTTYANDVAPPGNLVADFNPSDGSVRVTWSDNTNRENGTLIERKNGINGSYKEIASTGTDVSVYNDFNVQESETYYYRARHTTTEGFLTKYSNEDSAFVPFLAPAAPTNLKIFEFTSGVEYGLSWTDNSENEDGFQLYRREGMTGNYNLVNQYGKNTQADNVIIPDSNKTYYFKVRSFRVRNIGDTLFSDFSNEVNTEGKASGINAPQNLTANYISNQQGQNGVQLNWQLNSTGHLGIVVERKSQYMSNFSEIDRKPASTVSYFDPDDTDLAPTVKYYYRVGTYDANDNKRYSNVDSLTVPVP